MTESLKGINDTDSLAEHVTMDLFGLMQNVTDTKLYEITQDVVCVRILMVNVCFLGLPGDAMNGWVLVDAALPHSADSIISAAEDRFGHASKPNCIILTHGHFDHVGAVIELANHWRVPVYAHHLELPYLTGKADYPPPDPNADEGLIAKLAPLYPHNGINLGSLVGALPRDGSVPGAPGWRWVHTPGHTVGHVSLFRDYDGVLIAGDAFVTVKQESAAAVMTQAEEVHGPPMYFTTDWQDAKQSVQRLAALHPSIVAAGHGVPLSGQEMSGKLTELARHFDRLAVPEHGRYVEQPEY